MLTAVPEMTWLARRWIESTACTSAEQRRRPTIAPSRPITHEPVSWDTHDAPEAAHQHHPLEADVDDAGALREEAAQRAERERRRVLEGADEEPGRDDRGDRACSACATRARARTNAAKAAQPICTRRVMRAPLRAAARRRRGGDGPAVVVGSSARSRLARATSQRTTQLAADEQDDRALDDVRDAARELGAERARELTAAALQRGEEQRRRAPRRRPCCGRAARRRCP